MKVSIIILNYNCEQYIERCIKSIQYTGSHEIFVVDNENNAPLMKRLSHLKSIKIISNKLNLGFAKANNIAMLQAKGEYIFTLNSDAFLTKGYIESCVEFLETNQDYASVQGKLILEGDKSRIDSTGNVLVKSRFAYSENHKTLDREISSHEIFSVCAAAALYRKKALEEIRINDDFFDSDFFCNLEDVDIDWRLRLYGWKAFYLSDAVAYHVREATTNHSFRIKTALRNRLFMVLKNDSTLSMLVNLIFYTPILLLLPNKIHNVKLIKRMFMKRKIIQKHRVISHKIIRQMMKKTPYHKWLRIVKLLSLVKK